MQANLPNCDMTKEGKRNRSACATAGALDLIGDRWSLLILRDYIFKGARDYSQFIQMEEGISTNVLIARLKWLSEAGFLIKKPHPTNKKKFHYDITERGFDLIDTIMTLAEWSWKHLPVAFSPPEVKQMWGEDRDRFRAVCRERMEERSAGYLMGEGWEYPGAS